VYVYYEETGNLYYCYDEGSWKVSSFLPRRLEMDLGDYVVIEMETRQPYTKNKSHRLQYPPTPIERDDDE
jgi:hypothetical protein